MNLSRRALASAALLLVASPAHAERGLSQHVRARLRPGGPVWEIRATAVEEPERIVRIRAVGPGAPTSEIVLTSHYGGVQALKVVRLRGRDVVVTGMDGNGGTGLSQTLRVMMALTDDGQFRIIGIEQQEAQESGTCQTLAQMKSRLIPGPEDRLQQAQTFRRQRGPCGQRWTGRPSRESWTDELVWDGTGPITAAPPATTAGPVQRASAAARIKVADQLAQHPRDLRPSKLEDTGLYELVSVGLV